MRREKINSSFTTEYELFIVGRSTEFLAGWIKAVFVLSLLKEEAARWAFPLIDNNDTNLSITITIYLSAITILCKDLELHLIIQPE